MARSPLQVRWLAAGVCAASFACVSTVFGQADVIVGDLGSGDPEMWGTLNGISAYSIPTVSCNIGDVPLNWDGGSANHPVIGQNMYRIDDGRIEQLGMSWVKHGICALQQKLCGDCMPQGGCADKLGVGCSDPYSAFLNGSQGGMGPRSEVNASTGEFVWPFTTDGDTGNVLYKRIQVDNAEFDPELNPGAVYVSEGLYVAKDDAAAGNGFNNASYRRMVVTDFQGGGFELDWVGATQQQMPAIVAWFDHGLGANTPDPDVHVSPIDVADDGRFWVGYKVSDNGDGTWHYEYAVENINSHRSGGQLTIPVPTGVSVTNAGFHDVNYHSGEPFDDTDWSAERTADAFVWSSPETFEQNENSNALRWGTLYNFSFDADTAPVDGVATLGLFRPGAAPDPTMMVLVPGPAGDCVADFDGNGQLNILDFIALQDAFSMGDDAADINGDGMLNVLDFIAFQELFQEGC